MSDRLQSFMQSKMHEIKTHGVRGKKVPHRQRVAIALSYARKKGFRLPRRHRKS